MGASGGGRPDVCSQIERIVREILGCPVQVVGDMVIALAAAFGSGPGAIVIAGTGSIAYGRDVNGQTARAGGWGFAISDEGSGQWVGRTAVTRGLRGYDEAGSSALLATILREWPVASVDELVRAANAVPQPDFSRLFPIVLAAGDSGDESARIILAEAGTALAALAKLVIRRLFPEPSGAIPVAMTGSIFRQSALVRQAFYNEIRAAFPAAAINPTVVEPVLGALEMARNGVGVLAAPSSKGRP
jgi:glucosamine kinase